MKILAFILITLTLVLPALSFADERGTSVLNLEKDPPGIVTDAPGVFTAISRITDWLFSLFLVIAVIFILWGAFKLLTSGGGEGLAEAKKMILYAAIAVVIAVLAKSIIIVAANIVGVTGLNL